MEHTWSARFKPYLDPGRWPEYNRYEFRPDPALVITTRGRRQSKRFEMVMDKMKRQRNKFDAFSYETATKNHNTVCHKTGYINNKKFSCEMRAEATRQAARGPGAMSESVSAQASGNMHTTTLVRAVHRRTWRTGASRRGEAQPRAEWAV